MIDYLVKNLIWANDMRNNCKGDLITYDESGDDAEVGSQDMEYLCLRDAYKQVVKKFAQDIVDHIRE